MGRRCCLCNKTRSSTLHSFPKDESSKNLWKKICGFEEYDDVTTLHICSIHFRSSDYINPNGGIGKLKFECFPSVKVPNKVYFVHKGKLTTSLSMSQEEATTMSEYTSGNNIANQVDFEENVPTTLITKDKKAITDSVLDERLQSTALIDSDNSTIEPIWTSNKAKNVEKALILGQNIYKKEKLKNNSLRRKRGRLIEKIKSLQQTIDCFPNMP